MGLQLQEMAERVGFEPTIELPLCRISSAVLSTTQPPLRRGSLSKRFEYQGFEFADGCFATARRGQEACSYSHFAGIASPICGLYAFFMCDPGGAIDF